MEEVKKPEEKKFKLSVDDVVGAAQDLMTSKYEELNGITVLKHFVLLTGSSQGYADRPIFINPNFVVSVAEHNEPGYCVIQASDNKYVVRGTVEQIIRYLGEK